MSKIRGQKTKPELAVRKFLFSKGFRYRINDERYPGKPDIVLIRQKIAIFVDGDFWHGKDIEKIKRQIKSNRGYWIPKIERNVERAKEVNDALLADGWLVLRFWESDIKQNLDGCITKVMSFIGRGV